MSKPGIYAEDKQLGGYPSCIQTTSR